MSSVTQEVLVGITTVESAAKAWSTLQEMYGSHTHARSINTRIALAKTRKGTSTMADYFSTMKSYADEMAASGQSLTDEDFTTCVLTGLDAEFYNPLVSSIVTRVESIALPKLYSQMLNYDLHINKQSMGATVPNSFQMLQLEVVGHLSVVVQALEGVAVVVMVLAVDSPRHSHMVASPTTPTTGTLHQLIHLRDMNVPSARFVTNLVTQLISIGTDLMRNLFLILVLLPWHQPQLAMTPTSTWTLVPRTTSQVNLNT
jgi:hypothetical protein